MLKIVLLDTINAPAYTKYQFLQHKAGDDRHGRTSRGLRFPSQTRTIPEIPPFLQAVRLFKGMRPIDVCNASASPDFPGSKIKASALSRMEAGG
jgi:hypothetical protein